MGLIPEWARSVLVAAMLTGLVTLGSWQCTRQEAMETMVTDRLTTLEAGRIKDQGELARLGDQVTRLNQDMRHMMRRVYGSPRGSEAR